MGEHALKSRMRYRFLLRFSLACTSCANVGIEGGKAGALMAIVLGAYKVESLPVESSSSSRPHKSIVSFPDH
jgi:hypothetical protein